MNPNLFVALIIFIYFGLIFLCYLFKCLFDELRIMRRYETDIETQLEPLIPLEINSDTLT